MQAPAPYRRAPQDDAKPRAIVIGLLTTIGLWGSLDIVLDGTSSLSVHLLVHLGFIAMLFAVVFLLWSRWIQARNRLRAAELRAAETRAARDLWRTRASRVLQGLAVEIDLQFDRWQLSDPEREVALLLLKGLGLKEVASVLECSESSVRQRAASVYRKSGLGGRATLAAFFLEDVLGPPILEPQGSQAS